MRTQYDEVDVFSKAYTGTGTTFSALDRFDRTIISRWTKALTPNRNFYKVDVGYDENSNITYQDDGVHDGHDVLYTNDDLNRLIGAEEGTLTGGPPPTSITSRTRNQVWGLNQTGNWDSNLVDLDGDNDGADADELNETRTHNAVNELGARDIDSDASDDYSLAYDEVGNMTDDGEDYEHVWDVFGRLRAVYVRNTSPAKSDLVSEYRYNGLGYLVSRHQDTDTDGDVDGSDVTFEAVFDERWRVVATYRAGDSDPKELFLHHAAGASGFGGSSYIDHVVLRDRDDTNGWAGAADGTLEERIYYCQNWRADVVALIDDAGGMLEWVKYSAYGVPFGLPAKDADSDGDYDSADDAVISGWGAYDVRGDVNLDGVVDGGDTAASQAIGRGALTSTGVRNRRGCAGYEADSTQDSKWHVRNRILDADLGRWIRVDPLEYEEGVNLHAAMSSQPIARLDPDGLLSWTGAGAAAGGASLPSAGGAGQVPHQGEIGTEQECLSTCGQWEGKMQKLDAGPLRGRLPLGQNVCGPDGKICLCVASPSRIAVSERLDVTPSDATMAKVMQCIRYHEHWHATHHVASPCTPQQIASGSAPTNLFKDAISEADATFQTVRNCWNRIDCAGDRNCEQVRDQFKKRACEKMTEYGVPSNLRKEVGCP